MSLVYSIKETGGKLGVSRSTINRLLAKGDLRSTKIGRCRKITGESIDALVNKIAEPPKMPPRRSAAVAP